MIDNYPLCPRPAQQTGFPSASSTSPSVLRPGLEVKLATSTIFTANCWPVSLLMQRLTTLKGPLKHTHVELVADSEPSNKNSPGLCRHFQETHVPNHTHTPCADLETFLRKYIIAFVLVPMAIIEQWCAAQL